MGLEVERKGLKASEKSDHNVRKAYDNSHKPREDIKDAAKEAKHKGKEVGWGVIPVPDRVHVTAKLGTGLQHTAQQPSIWQAIRQVGWIISVSRGLPRFF